MVVLLLMDIFGLLRILEVKYANVQDALLIWMLISAFIDTDDVILKLIFNFYVRIIDVDLLRTFVFLKLIFLPNIEEITAGEQYLNCYIIGKTLKP